DTKRSIELSVGPAPGGLEEGTLLTLPVFGTAWVIWPRTTSPATSVLPFPNVGLNWATGVPPVAMLNRNVWPVTSSALQKVVPSGSRFRANQPSTPGTS